MSGGADTVRAFLSERGCAPHVIERGLEGLLETWARVVDELARGYRFGLDDYCNDMDGRQLLFETLEIVGEEAGRPYRSTLAGLDRRANELLAPPADCIWGAELARRNDWKPEVNWWYFRIPKQPGAELAEDLATWGDD